jgi:hypothetical protein
MRQIVSMKNEPAGLLMEAGTPFNCEFARTTLIDGTCAFWAFHFRITPRRILNEFVLPPVPAKCLKS